MLHCSVQCLLYALTCNLSLPNLQFIRSHFRLIPQKSGENANVQAQLLHCVLWPLCILSTHSKQSALCYVMRQRLW